jgi:hypothetical protein
MPTYHVLVTRAATESAVVEVSGPGLTAEQAEARAVELARARPADYAWDADEPGPNKPDVYFGGRPGETEPLAEHD